MDEPAPQPRSSPSRSPSDGGTRFAVDCMLGTLAKWLRILGYDALYLNRVEDAELVERARAEGRVLLTRDRRLTERRRARPFVLIESEGTLAQLRETLAALGLSPSEERLLTRCLRCNEPTREVSPEEVAPRVPPYVLATQRRFRLCSTCQRVYWGATHRDHILAKLRTLSDAG